MMESLRHDDIIQRCGGRFKLTALIQRRWLELMQGERPMVDTEGKNEIEIIVEEIMQGKLDFEVGEATDAEGDE